MQVAVITSDKTSWALRPQAYLLDKYWKQHGPIIIGGYTRPDFGLPDDYSFVSLGDFADYPVGKWSDGLIKFLSSLTDDVVLFLMDDYWPNRDVDSNAIHWLADYMRFTPDVSRLDLTNDRLGAKGWEHYGSVGCLDIIKSDPESLYHFSFQAALWQRQRLLNCLAPFETPWESEIEGDGRIKALGYIVLGTRQCPLRYTIAVQQGKLALDGGYQTASYALPAEDIEYITAQGWLDHA